MTHEISAETIAEQAKQLRKQGIEFYEQHNFESALKVWQQEIELDKSLPLENPEYRNKLAEAYRNCGDALDDLRQFEQAINHYQQAIALGKQLPLDNPQYCNDLARAYNGCGVALKNLRLFEQAINHYQQAIELGTALPLDNPQYRNQLAKAYNNCGGALCDKLRRFEQAIEHFQQAIALCKQLPLDNPEYRSQLASAYFNCGNALKNLRRFEQAIEHYQQAIALHKQLPLDNPEYRNDLASAHYNYGATLKKLRRFEQAIEHFQQAIALRKQLPLDNPEYRNELATAYNSCGAVAVLCDNLRRFEQAIEYCQQAIELHKSLPLDNPKYRNELASAYNNLSAALYNLRCYQEAEDAIEESLTILRQLEQQGIYWFRENREQYFTNAITIYLRGSFNFLPELILEHLDPINDGAAPQSEKMHQAALKGLHDLFVHRTGKYPELISTISKTLIRLAEIRAKYFAGTVDGAKLTAQFYEEHVGDIDKAEEILKTYTEQVKDDPEGYKQLADFYVRRNNINQAIDTYQQALQIILQQPLEASQQQAITEILKLIYLLKATDNSVDGIQEWYTDWSRTLPKTTYDTIKPLHKIALEPIKEAQKSTEFQKQIQQRVEIQIHITLQAIQVLPASLKTIGDVLVNAQKQLSQEDIDNEEAVNDRIETLQNTLTSQLPKLPETELQDAEQQLKQTLPDLWQKLTFEEQQALKTGLSLYQLQIPNYYQAACSYLGLAIETSLKTHLFQPAKQYIQNNQLPVEYLHEKDFIAGFFDNHPKAKLMLGNLIGGFNQTFHDNGNVTHEQNVSYLRQYLPNYQIDTNAQKKRAKQLNQIVTIRNQLHQSPEQSQQNVTKMIDMVYQNSQDGFYRYFLTALETNHEHTQITG